MGKVLQFPSQVQLAGQVMFELRVTYSDGHVVSVVLDDMDGSKGLEVVGHDTTAGGVRMGCIMYSMKTTKKRKARRRKT